MTAHAKLSPSKADRWIACTASAALEATLPAPTSVYAEEGTHAHKVCELYAKKKFGIPTPMKPSDFTKQLKAFKKGKWWNDEMTKTAETYVDHLLQHYMSFAVAPAVALEVRVDLSAYVPEGFGTCDSVMIGLDENGDGVLIVTDYKHGKGVAVEVEENPQLMCYALGALTKYWIIYGDRLKKVVLCIDQPRLDSYKIWEVSADDLRDWGEQVLAPRAQIAASGAGEFAAGDHCRFCRAAATCRHRAEACTALAEFADAIPEATATDQQCMQVEVAKSFGVPPSQPLLTDEEISDFLQKGEKVAKWLTALKEYVFEAIMSGRAIPGYKVVAGRSSRCWTDQDQALAVLMAAGVAEEVIYERVAKTLAQLETIIGKKDFAEMAGQYIQKPPGKPTLALETDPRPAYNAAAADFAGVEL